VPGIRIVERSLMPHELEAADEVFISSTTRNLMPVLSIEGRATGRATAVREALQQGFADYVRRYIAGRRSAAMPPAV
jgi:branched-chain amino acid aminotransferase